MSNIQPKLIVKCLLWCGRWDLDTTHNEYVTPRNLSFFNSAKEMSGDEFMLEEKNGQMTYLWQPTILQ
jgi:hypothetical protein